MNPAQETASSSVFRSVALVTSTVAAILFVLCAVAVARYGGQIRDFGWTLGRADGELIVESVDPNGAASGILEYGDVLVAWNGDHRVTRVGTLPFRRNLGPDA